MKKINKKKIILFFMSFCMFCSMSYIVKANDYDVELIDINKNIVELNEYKLYIWGIKDKVKSWISNNRDYEWYIDQKCTGKYSSENCGATIATMAIKWDNKDFNKTVEDARNSYHSSGGWWCTNDIENYLNENNVQTSEVEFNYTFEQIKELIDNGSILILCINTNPLKLSCNTEERTNCFYYKRSKGHFIIVKGYVLTENNIYLEVYDPLSWGEKYIDDTFKGKDRLYKYDEIEQAIKLRWTKLMVVNGNLNDKPTDNK